MKRKISIGQFISLIGTGIAGIGLLLNGFEICSNTVFRIIILTALILQIISIIIILTRKEIWAKMKKYEYVNIKIGKFIGSKSEEHREIIDKYAAKGFKYVGYIPTKITDYGRITEMDLIFESENDF